MTVIAAAAAALCWWLAQPPRLTADFLDVGQGDATLLRVGRIETLVDGGPDATVLSGLGEAMPILDRSLETIVLTHPHADHLIGLIHAIKQYDVGVIYYTGAAKTPEWSALVAAAKERGVPMKLLAAGMKLTLADQTITVLWPPPKYQPPGGDENYRSAVLCVRPTASSSSSSGLPAPWSASWAKSRSTRGTGSRGSTPPNVSQCNLLLTGDAPSDVEAQLLKANAVPRAQVLKVGHHGSRTSTSSAFLAAVHPAVAVIEVGKNSYGHPAWATLQRLKKTGARLYETLTDGHVRLTFSPDDTPKAITGLLATWPPLK